MKKIIVLRQGLIMITTLIVGIIGSQPLINNVSTNNIRMNSETTLVVTSTANPNDLESMRRYVESVVPLLLDLGGTVVKRSRIDEIYHGESCGQYLLIMDFPDKEELRAFFDGSEYQQLIPFRDKGFQEIDILFAKNL